MGAGRATTSSLLHVVLPRERRRLAGSPGQYDDSQDATISAGRRSTNPRL